MQNLKGDWLIRGGIILDGTGRPPRQADLAVVNGRIQEIGTIEAVGDWPTIDASGLFVAPGFIDVHSHSDFTLLMDPRAMSSITQGVTLEVIGNCGHGCAPIRDLELVKSNIYGFSESYPIEWQTMGEYLEVLENRRPAVNVVTLVPNGNLRLAAAGLVDRPSTPDEIQAMTRMIEQSLEEGAFGFSTGLEYSPERACSEEEVTQLCKVVAGAGGIYATHTRHGEAQDIIDEALRTGEAARVPLQISHIGIVARLAEDGRRAVEKALASVDDAEGRGVDVGFDMHTRDHGITTLSAALPTWIFEGGKAALGNRLQDRSVREQLKTYPNLIAAEAAGSWDKILLFDCQSKPQLARRSIADIGEELGVEPLDAVYDILLSEIDRIHEVLVINYNYEGSDLRLPFDHPACMPGSDATALATDGPLKGRCFHGAFTWASWFYRYFVREKATLSPQECVRRLTSLPANRFGLKNRGVLQKGAWADVVIFDPESFGERGTLFDPNQTARGMVHVLVNGTLTLKDAQLTGARSGHIVRRT